MAFNTWATSQISRLLPLDEDSLKQIIEYAQSLSKEAAAEHLKNLLGDSPQALEFISSFNSRREAPKEVSAPSQPSGVPHRPRKKGPLNKLPPPRRPEDYGNTEGAYHKKNEGEYMAGSYRSRKEPPLANAFGLSDRPEARQLPLPQSASSSTTTSRNASPRPPPSAAGSLISDLPDVRTSSRTSSPAPKTKINLSGGTSMHGASTTLNDLDSAIRTLEIQTNPSLSSSTASDTAKRRCNCQATRHPLLAAAPNCLNCGKIICVKEGIGPCTFCSHPLLSPEDIQSMVRSLREERGREKMDLYNQSQRRPDISKAPRPFQSLSTTNNDPDPATTSKLAQAQQHRDKLLTYQSQNARRTRIIDEASDFETPTSGQSMWSSPVERAAQLKRQQKVLREQEWNARPEYEKRKMVVSVDLVGGKVVKRMGEVKREDVEGEDRDVEDEDENEDGAIPHSSATEANAKNSTRGTGAFGRNPLMGGLIRPVWRRRDDADDHNGNGKGKGREREEGGAGAGGWDLGGDWGGDGQGDGNDDDDDNKENRHRNNIKTNNNTWRRVQDDNDDNEAWILDGGVYGGREGEEGDGDRDRRLGGEERVGG